MLEKAKQYKKGIVIFRRGLGYYFKLSIYYTHYTNIPLSFLKWILKTFTNIKFPTVYIMTHRHEVLKLIYQIVLFNSVEKIDIEELKHAEHNQEKLKHIPEVLPLIIDTLSSQYGWTQDYIFESVDYIQAIKLIKIINKRIETNWKMQAIASKNPEGIFEIYDGKSEEVSVAEALEIARQKAKRQ